jgi:hypothetical protein
MSSGPVMNVSMNFANVCIWRTGSSVLRRLAAAPTSRSFEMLQVYKRTRVRRIDVGLTFLSELHRTALLDRFGSCVQTQDTTDGLASLSSRRSYLMDSVGLSTQVYFGTPLGNHTGCHKEKSHTNLCRNASTCFNSRVLIVHCVLGGGPPNH